jgi:hypothetical protein
MSHTTAMPMLLEQGLQFYAQLPVSSSKHIPKKQGGDAQNRKVKNWEGAEQDTSTNVSVIVGNIC